MCCAVAAKEVQRSRAHPTVHAFSSSKTNRYNSEASSLVIPGLKGGGRAGRTKGAIWSDANTGPISKFPAKSSKKKASGAEVEFKTTETEEIALRNEVRLAMQNVKQRNMKTVLPTLRTLDKGKTGKITFEKVKQTLQTNQLSLSETGFRNLGKKFGEKLQETHVVRYEKLVTYLTKLWSEAAALPKKRSTTPPAAGFSNTGRVADVKRYAGGSNRLIKMRNRVIFRDSDLPQLLSDLGDELMNCHTIKMADLRITMYNFDRDRNNFLTEGQVYASFQNCGIFLSPEVFQQLLVATDRTGAGTYGIDTLIDYLIQARPDLQQYLLLGESHHPRRARVPLLPALSDQPTFATPWNQANDLEEDDPEEVEDMYDDGSIGIVEEEEPEEPFDSIRWSEDFRNLEEALHQADEDRLGFMPEKEVRRTAKTYGLVYNLGITDSTLNAALQEAFDISFKEINLDHFASSLQTKHFKYMSES